MEYNQIVLTYNLYSAVLALVESGRWRNNKLVANLSVEQVEHMRYICDNFDKLNLRQKTRRAD